MPHPNRTINRGANPDKKPRWNRDAERDLIADACVPGRHEHSLWNFCRYAAGWYYRCQEPGQPNWLVERVHRPMLDWLQNLIVDWKTKRRNGEQERLQFILWAFRGVGKSNLVTKCVPLYCMLDEPDATFYIGSETLPKAKEMLAPMKEIISGKDPYALFTWLFGNWYDPERTWTIESITTAFKKTTAVTEPSIGTFGVETGMTGKHPLGCMYDDPLTEEKLAEGERSIQAAINSVDAIYPALRNDSMLGIEATRYRDMDVIGSLLAREGIASWSGHRPPERRYLKTGGRWHVYFLQARDLANTTTYPDGEPVLPEAGWTHEALKHYEARRPQHYAAQMMGDPVRHQMQEITEAQIDSLKIDRKDLPPIEYATIHIDTAFKVATRRERGDNTAIVVWLHDLRNTGIVYFDRGLCSPEWRSEDFDAQLIRVMFDLKYRGIRIRAITDENEMGGKRGVYLQHLTSVISGAGLRVPEILQLNRAGNLKMVRIREALGYWIEGYVRLVRDAEGLSTLIREVTRLEIEPYDDMADASADVFRPEIWRRKSYNVDDYQPALPIQPGDDVLKARLQSEYRDIQRELRGQTGRDEDPQPFEEMIVSHRDRENEEGFWR